MRRLASLAILLFVVATSPAQEFGVPASPVRPPVGTPRDLGQPVDIRVVMEFGGQSVPLNYDPDDPSRGTFSGEDMLSRTRDRLTEIYGGTGWESSSTWRHAQILADPRFLGAAQRVTDMAPRDSHEVWVNLVLDDDPKNFSTGRYGEGYPDRFVDDTAEITRWEPIHPNAVQRPWFHPDGTFSTQQITQVTLGEAGSAAIPNPAQMILHELGHSADRARSGANNVEMGPDGKHAGVEVIAPNRAMKEGWANYTSTLLPREYQDQNRVLDEIQRGTVLLVTEGNEAGKYTVVAPWDRDAGQYVLGNELAIAGALRDMAELPGGMEAVTATLRRTNDLESRTFADFTGAYVSANPESRDAVREILERRSHGLGDEAFYDGMLAGKLPDGVDPRVPYMGGDYVRSERPEGWDPVWDSIDLDRPRDPRVWEADQEAARMGRQTWDPNGDGYWDGTSPLEPYTPPPAEAGEPSLLDVDGPDGGLPSWEPAGEGMPAGDGGSLLVGGSDGPGAFGQGGVAPAVYAPGEEGGFPPESLS